MPVRVEVKLVHNYIPQLTEQAQRLAAQVVAKTAYSVQANAMISIATGTKSGRLYKRGNIVHQASAPGEAPAVDTGNLINSIRARRITAMAWEVIVRAAYGSILEFGGRKMAARPFMVPALIKERARFINAMQQIIKYGRR